MKQIPNIAVQYDRGDDLVVSNWDEINLWGCYNDLTWHATMQHMALSEMDKMRLLAGKLLAEKHMLQERLQELMLAHGIPSNAEILAPVTLLACPFCGSNKVYTSEHDTTGIVYCQNCGGQMHARVCDEQGSFIAEAAKRWNRRHANA